MIRRTFATSYGYETSSFVLFVPVRIQRAHSPQVSPLLGHTPGTASATPTPSAATGHLGWPGLQQFSTSKLSPGHPTSSNFELKPQGRSDNTEKVQNSLPVSTDNQNSLLVIKNDGEKNETTVLQKVNVETHFQGDSSAKGENV